MGEPRTTRELLPFFGTSRDIDIDWDVLVATYIHLHERTVHTACCGLFCCCSSLVEVDVLCGLTPTNDADDLQSASSTDTPQVG